MVGPRTPAHDYRWICLGWSHAVTGGLSPDTRSRLVRTRRRFRASWPLTRAIDLEWRDDASVAVRFRGHPGRLSTAWRRTATLTFDDRPIFIEAFGGAGRGPLWGFTDVRLHVDGRLEGRAWHAGCVYGGGPAVTPAVAFVREGVALAIGLEDRQLELRVGRRGKGPDRRSPVRQNGALWGKS